MRGSKPRRQAIFKQLLLHFNHVLAAGATNGLTNTGQDLAAAMVALKDAAPVAAVARLQSHCSTSPDAQHDRISGTAVACTGSDAKSMDTTLAEWPWHRNASQ